MTQRRQRVRENTYWNRTILLGRRQAPHRYVTITMNKVEFKKPVFIGDIVSFYADTTRIGRSSISVHVTVKGERRCPGQTGQRLVLTEADLTYVAIDEDNKPVPIFDNN